jgi:hypothetical protein
MRLSITTKYTIYSFLIFLSSGIYFLLAYKGYSSQIIDLETIDRFTGRVTQRGIADRNSSKATLEVFYLTLDGLTETLGIYRQENNYSGLIDEIQPGDTVTVYYLGTSGSDGINIDLVQIEKGGEVIVDQAEFKKKESFLTYIGLVAGLFSVGMAVGYYKKYVGF